MSSLLCSCRVNAPRRSHPHAVPHQWWTREEEARHLATVAQLENDRHLHCIHTNLAVQRDSFFSYDLVVNVHTSSQVPSSVFVVEQDGQLRCWGQMSSLGVKKWFPPCCYGVEMWKLAQHATAAAAAGRTKYWPHVCQIHNYFLVVFGSFESWSSNGND